MFSQESSSSISLATVTPSLVTVGEPKDFSSTTLRPDGPSVTLTARASFETPRRMLSRASWSNAILLAAMFFLLNQMRFHHGVHGEYRESLRALRVLRGSILLIRPPRECRPRS